MNLKLLIDEVLMSWQP